MPPDLRAAETLSPVAWRHATGTVSPAAHSTHPLDLVDIGPGPYLFLSPHLDDVALSCCSLVKHLATRAPVLVLTVFTEAAPPPHTLSARAFLAQCGHPDALELYAGRRAEDIDVLNSLAVEHVHLGLTEALFRTRPGRGWTRRLGLPCELRASYPTYRFHITRGITSRHDRGLVRLLSQALEDVLERWQPACVFAPMGIGGHVDHRIVASVAGQLLPDAVFYGDLPYALVDGVDEALVQRRRLVPLSWSDDLSAKTLLLARYRSQMRALFPAGTPELPECYFVAQERLRVRPAGPA